MGNVALEPAVLVLLGVVARRSLQRAPRLVGLRRPVTDAWEHRLHRVCGVHDADEDSDCLAFHWAGILVCLWASIVLKLSRTWRCET
jgi:hypothetical protein